jgi:hypothetical protein
LKGTVLTTPRENLEHAKSIYEFLGDTWHEPELARIEFKLGRLLQKMDRQMEAQVLLQKGRDRLIQTPGFKGRFVSELTEDYLDNAAKPIGIWPR